MNSRSVKVLAVVVIVLFGVLFALNREDRSEPRDGSNLLFPDLKARLNDLTQVTVTDADETITLKREGEAENARWVVPERAGYSADTGKLRQLLVALSDAEKVEQKTSDPELYERLGVADPREDGGEGVLVTAGEGDASISLILGDSAQQDFRYARVPEQAESWLVNQNPVLPEDSAGWLLSEIVNIESSRISSVAIRHSDGEVVGIHKENPDDTNFEVENIPEGRELSYPSVANGIAGALGNLTLEDVRKPGGDEEPSVTAEFTTFDGLAIRVSVASENVAGDSDDEDTDEQHWITLEVSATEAAEKDEEAAGGNAADSGPPAEEPGEAGETGEKTADETDQQPAAEQAGPAEEAATINARVDGWAYRISTYKAEQLTRRWEDILRSEEDEGTS